MISINALRRCVSMLSSSSTSTSAYNHFQRTAIRSFSSTHLALADLNDDQLRFQKICRIFAEAELKPIAGEMDKSCQYPAEQITKLGDLGVMGMLVDTKYGGCSMDMLSLCIAIEELSRGCASTGIIVSIHNCLYADLLNRRGTDAQKEEFLRPFSRGEVGAFALSEHDAGSDVANISCRADLDGDHYVLNGSKAWVTSASEAEAGIIFATVDKKSGHKGITAFIVPFNTPGLSIGRKEDKMGIKATSTCSLVLQDVRVPKTNVIGNIGEGFSIAMKQLQLARIGVSAQAIGIGQASLDLAVSYAKSRNMFGGKLSDMQLTKSKIAQMAMDLEAARLVTWQAAMLRDIGADYRKMSSMAKFLAGQCAVSNANRCVQVLGGKGFVCHLAAERHYRDARITQIYGGTSEVQELLIADQIIKEYD